MPREYLHRIDAEIAGRLHTLTIMAADVQHLLDGGTEYLNAAGQWVLRLPAESVVNDSILTSNPNAAQQDQAPL